MWSTKRVNSPLDARPFIVIQFLRAVQTRWVARILLVVVVLSLVMMRSLGNFSGGSGDETIASVGQVDVGVRQFLIRYNSNKNKLQRKIGHRLSTAELKQSALEGKTLKDVLAYAAIDDFAKANNLSLTDSAQERLLKENKRFHNTEGVFDKELFTRTAHNARMNEGEYLELQHVSQIRNQVISIAAGDILPKTFTKALSEYFTEERKFSYIKLTSGVDSAVRSPTQAELKEYYRKNLDKYKSPERRNLVILKVDARGIAQEDNITLEEIAVEYSKRVSAQQKLERRRVQQFIFETRAEAEAAAEAISEGATFESILAANNNKISTRDTRLVRKDELPAAIGNIAFSLQMNRVSNIIEGPLGPTLINITEIQQNESIPLKEIRDEIRTYLARVKAANSLYSIRNMVIDALAGATPLDQIARQLGLKLRVVKDIDRTGLLPNGTLVKDLPASSDLLDQAFKAEVGTKSPPIQLKSGGYAWFEVVEITPPRESSFDEVAVLVKRDWISARKAERLTQIARNMKTRIARGALLDDIARELKVATRTTKFLKRTSKTSGFPRAAIEAGFSGDKDVVAVVDGTEPSEKLIVVVAGRRLGRPQTTATSRKQVFHANRAAANDFLFQMVTSLLRANLASINHNLISKVTNPNYR